MLDSIDYSSDQAASEGLLGEVSKLLSESGVNHVILGGWVPFRFHSETLTHPGTYDVDVLFEDDIPTKSINSLIAEFEQHGYMRAAKNGFQVYRMLTVSGKPKIFHVDFMHRRYAAGQDAEHIIYYSDKKLQSIAGPGTDFIFPR